MKETRAFFTPVFEFELPEDATKQAADYIRKVRDETETSLYRSNEGGWHSPDWFEWNVPDELHAILRIIHHNVAEVYRKYNFNKEPELSNCWAIINKKGDYNAQHNHGGGTLMSGVVYLSVPEGNAGRLVLVRDDIMTTAYSIQLIENRDSEYRHELYYVVPETTKGVIFPWHVNHYVEMNTTDEERIILSYNFR